MCLSCTHRSSKHAPLALCCPQIAGAGAGGGASPTIHASVSISTMAALKTVRPCTRKIADDNISLCATYEASALHLLNIAESIGAREACSP